ncbi:MAG: peptidoglycan-binding domain-containing protein [Gemmatimonadota bacterium]
MPIHTVAQGECMSSIAALYGFADYQLIYGDGANAGLRGLRPNPNVLYPGDRVFVPELKPSQHDCAVDAKHRFVLKRSRARLRLVLKDRDGPMAQRPYTLTVPGQAPIDGVTDGGGLLDQPVPDGAQSAELRLQRGSDPKSGVLVWALQLGALDPHDKVSGAQARLNNLGFFCGTADGVLGPRTAQALRSFQQQSGLPQTGHIDAATSDRLLGLHDDAS